MIKDSILGLMIAGLFTFVFSYNTPDIGMLLHVFLISFGCFVIGIGYQMTQQKK